MLFQHNYERPDDDACSQALKNRAETKDTLSGPKQGDVVRVLRFSG
jgi:hypothetical protein